MAYGRRGKRYDPRAEERREREAKEEARYKKTKSRLHRLLEQFKLVKLSGDAAQAAWGEPVRRSFTVGKTSGGDYVTEILRGTGRHIFLQRATYLGWEFFRLVPRYHVLRSGESDRDRRRSRRQR